LAPAQSIAFPDRSDDFYTFAYAINQSLGMEQKIRDKCSTAASRTTSSLRSLTRARGAASPLLDSGSLPDRGSVYLVTHFLPLPTYLSEAPDAEIRAHLPTYPAGRRNAEARRRRKMGAAGEIFFYEACFRCKSGFLDVDKARPAQPEIALSRAARVIDGNASVTTFRFRYRSSDGYATVTRRLRLKK
jgi:hypothetical protein